MASLAQRLGPQVRAEALLRFGPQEQQLAQRLAQLRAARSQSIGAARTAMEGAVIGTARARPALEAIYAPIVKAADTRAANLATRLAGQPSSAFKDAAGVEAQAAHGRSVNELANAQAELVQRAQEARSGSAFAVNQANRDFASGLATLHSDLSALAAQEGAYASGRLGTLLQQDRSLRHSTNQQRRQQTFQAGQQDERIAAADRRAAERDAAAEARRHAAGVKARRKGEAKAQQVFEQAHAILSSRTVTDAAGKVVPVTQAYVESHRAQEIALMVKGGVPRKLAARVVAAYLQVGSSDPGSFKSYRAGAAPYIPNL